MNITPGILVSFLSVGPAALAQNIFVDFNTPGQLSDNFNIYQNATHGMGSPYSQSAVGGLGNSGAVGVLPGGGTVTQDSTAVYRAQSIDFSNRGTLLSISEFVNVIPISAGGNRLLQLGFVNESNSGMNGNAGLAFMSLRLSTVGSSGNTYTPAYQDKTAAGNTFNTTLAPNVTLTPGSWYKLSGEFLNLGEGSFQVSGLLQEYGPTGLEVPVTVFTFPAQVFANTEMTTDTAVWAAFRSFHNDGASGLDDFAAQEVPEPKATALWTLGMVGLGGWYGLRQKKTPSPGSPARV